MHPKFYFFPLTLFIFFYIPGTKLTLAQVLLSFTDFFVTFTKKLTYLWLPSPAKLGLILNALLAVAHLFGSTFNFCFCRANTSFDRLINLVGLINEGNGETVPLPRHTIGNRRGAYIVIIFRRQCHEGDISA